MDHHIRRFKVAESIYHECMNKEEVLKLRNVYIVCGSPKKKFSSCEVYISCVDHEKKVLNFWRR